MTVRTCPKLSASYFDGRVGVFIYPTRRTVCLSLSPRARVRFARGYFGEVLEGCHSDSETAMKLHVDLGRASAQQLKRVLADWGGGDLHSATCAGEVFAQRGVCRASDKAPHAPIVRVSTVATFDERLQVDLLFVGDIIASHAMGVSSE